MISITELIICVTLIIIGLTAIGILESRDMESSNGQANVKQETK